MLDTIELFQGLSNTELLEISEITTTVSYERGDCIFLQNDYSRDFFIIKSGQVEISVKDSFQEKKVLSIMKNGEFFGEMALFDKNSTRAATATALQLTSLLKLPGDRFELLLKEKPSISFKLLGALSKRLKDSNASKKTTPESPQTEASVLTIASPRNGYGKTTFSTSISHMLSIELQKQILYIDLDLNFADGTFALGVFSPKSILNLSDAVKNPINTREELHRHLVKHTDFLYSLPAPKDLLDGDKISPEDVAACVKICRKFFDYVIIDTAGCIDEISLTALELADHVIFLADVSNTIAIKSNARYFQGLHKLQLPEDNMYVLAKSVDAKFDPEFARNLFKFKVLGGLPHVENLALDHGQTLYHIDPASPYNEVCRAILKKILKEDGLSHHSEKGFFYRMLFSPGAAPAGSNLLEIGNLTSLGAIDITEENCTTLLKYVRSSIINGYLDKALSDAMRLVDIFPRSSMVFQTLGEIYSLQNNISPGIDALKKALEIDPRNHLAMEFLANVTADQALREKAIDLLRQKLEKNPSYPDLNNDMGRLLFFGRKLPEAKKFFEKALAINDQYSEARINLAVMYGETQEFDAAIKVLQQITPKNPRVHYLLGNFYFNTGKFFEALSAFTSVSEVNPNYLDIRGKINHLEEYFQKLQNLLKMHQEVAATSPKYPDIHYKIGNLLLLLGKQEEAIDSFAKAVELNPGYQEARKKLDTLKAARPVQVPPAPAAITIDSSFVLEISFSGIPAIKDPASGIQSVFSFQVKNTRTDKTQELPLTLNNLKAGKIEFPCDQLAPLAPGDLLVIQIFDPAARTVLATLPHIITSQELKQKHGRHLLREGSQSWRYPQLDAAFQVPLRYFHVSLTIPQIGGKVTGASPQYRAEVKNMNNGLKSYGQPLPENLDQLSFIFMASDNHDVVKSGDNLEFSLYDQKGGKAFCFAFPVLEEDIDSFTKHISLSPAEVVLTAG